MWIVVGTLLFISLFVVPSILAHSARLHPEHPALRWALYAIYIIYIGIMGIMGLIGFVRNSDAQWFIGVTIGFPLLAFLCLFRPVRRLLPRVLTPLNNFASLNFLCSNAPRAVPEAARATFHDASMLKQIFLPESLPHLNGLVLYLFSLGISLQKLNTAGFLNPSLGTAPEARQIDFALAADFLSTLLVVACGVGILISRRPREVLYRLSLVKPGKKEFAIGMALCLFTFFYDYLWSLFTHGSHSSAAYPSVMRAFNEGTYLGHGDAASALAMAIAIGVVAGFEEEITTRGALQPVLGIIPAAFLHAALHSQFNAAPLFMLQIFGWSALMGTVKYYTNTTTTIIAHGLFNFISCFLIGFNP